VLVFSAGPPFLDVAYRVVNKEWDPRTGGVRSTFEPESGKFRLYFRFKQTFYKR
jgi:hypothetical protein